MENQRAKYQELRQETISEALFRELVFLYPTLAVLEADEHLDKFEEHFLHEHAEKRAEINPEVSKAELEREVTYLLKNLKTDQEVFLIALKEFLSSEEDYTHLLDSMLIAARVSSDDWNNNVLYKENLPTWLSWSKMLIGGFLKPHPEKKFISEDEKNVILNILQDVDGLTDRNVKILEQLA